MEQAAIDLVYKKQNKGTTNTDLEVKKIGIRVAKMLMAQDTELCAEERRAMLARKYFQPCRGEKFPDDLASFRKYFEQDLFRLCDAELSRTYKVCVVNKQKNSKFECNNNTMTTAMHRAVWKSKILLIFISFLW